MGGGGVMEKRIELATVDAASIYGRTVDERGEHKVSIELDRHRGNYKARTINETDPFQGATVELGDIAVILVGIFHEGHKGVKLTQYSDRARVVIGGWQVEISARATPSIIDLGIDQPEGKIWGRLKSGKTEANISIRTYFKPAEEGEQ